MTAELTAPERSVASTWWVKGLAWAAVIVAATAAQLVRQTGLHSWATVWAEDGTIFFTGTRTLGQLFDGYAGYLQLVPRILGLGAHAVSLENLARYYAVAGALVTTLCGVAVWWFARQLVTSKVLRAVLALSVVLLPTLVLEQLANGVNTIWAITFAGWWAILYRPRSLPDAGLAAAVAFLAVTSNALALAFVPVVALLVWQRRGKPMFLVGGAFLVGTVVQLAVMAASGGPESQAANRITEFPTIYGVRVAGSALVGEHWVGGAWSALGTWFAVLSIAVVIAVVVLLVWFAPPRARGFGLLTLAYSVGLWLVSVAGRGSAALRLPEVYTASAERWSSISIWMLLSGAFILASGLRPGSAKRLVVAAFAAQFAVVAVVGFRAPNGRSAGPAWPTSLDNARAGCVTPGGPHRHVLVLSVPPLPNWSVRISCPSGGSSSR